MSSSSSSSSPSPTTRRRRPAFDCLDRRRSVRACVRACEQYWRPQFSAAGEEGARLFR
jgi:hypothetical protein